MLTLDPSRPGRAGRETLGEAAGFEVSGEQLGFGGVGSPGDQAETLSEFWELHRDCGDGVAYEREDGERIVAARCVGCASWFWGTGPAYVGQNLSPYWTFDEPIRSLAEDA